MKKRLVILDLDDTLIDTSDVYWHAKEQFLNILNRYGINKTDAGHLFEENDTLNMKTYSYSPNRYLITMKDTYDFYLKKNLVPKQNEVDKEIEDCGLIIFKKLPTLIHGSIELLKFLESGFITILITRGTRALQLEKIEKVGIGIYFNEIEVVDYKNSSIFKEKSDKYNLPTKECWVIGDSIKSDINPGIEAGFNCIQYKYRHHTYQWIQEMGVDAIGDFYQITDLLDAIKILNKEK